MLDTLFWIAVGMVIGWNLLPQPMWVKVLWERTVAKFKSD